MHRKTFVLPVFSALLMAFVLVADASADKGGQGKGGGNSGKGASHGSGKGGQGNSGGHDNAGGNPGSKGKGARKFDTSERTAIQRYYQDEYRRSGNCPPGLAKKNNGCLPPGQAKRNWDAGDTLPPDVVLYPLPPELRASLAVPLPGYDYGYADGGVLLYATSGRVVVDFVIGY